MGSLAELPLPFTRACTMNFPMKPDPITIRPAHDRDREAIGQIHLAAFSDAENRTVATLADNLLGETSQPPTLSLLAEIQGKLIGHIAFSPVTLDTAPHIQGYILAPLGIDPAHQRQGIGSRLIDHGIQQLSEMEVDLVFVYGDPAYYGRFGFREKTAHPYPPPYPLEYPFGWQAWKLTDKNASPGSISCVPSLCSPELW